MLYYTAQPTRKDPEKLGTVVVGGFTAAWTIGNTIQKAVVGFETAKKALEGLNTATKSNIVIAGKHRAEELVKAAATAKATEEIVKNTLATKGNELAKAHSAVTSAKAALEKTQEALATAKATASTEGQTMAYYRNLAATQTGSAASKSLALAKTSEAAAVKATTTAYELENSVILKSNALKTAQNQVLVAKAAFQKADIAAINASTVASTANVTAISAKTALVGVLTGKIGKATGAQLAWKAAMTANPKPMRFLDTVRVEKFTVKQVGESCIEKCCQPCPVGVEVKNSVLILSAITNCIEPDIEYTFYVDRAIPIDFNALQVFIKVEPCGFFRGAVELEKTTVVVPYHGEPDFKFTAENLKNFYRAKFMHGFKHEGKEDGVIGLGEHFQREIPRFDFLEVDKDLRGNISTGSDFFRHKFGFHGVRDKDRYVLYMNNAGRLVLQRGLCETRRFGDFR
jgi:hypothetical protein